MTKNRIEFKRIWCKNFRSIDNTGIELIYQNGTWMVGSLDNGAGKSTTLVYALYYALWDKNYIKGDSKSALINSRSNKSCEVHVEFNANGSLWKIIRGMKPTLFEIYKDGVKIEDEASLRDYGENIHKILGMDEKVFCNTVILGQDRFVPFVSMSAPDRRSYGEQMLDLVFISKMNDLNKEAIKVLNVEMAQTQTQMNNKEVEVKNLNNIISLKKQQAAEVSADLDSQIVSIGSQAKDLSVNKASAKIRQDEVKSGYDILAKERDLLFLDKNKQTSLLTVRNNFQSKIDQHEAVKHATLKGIEQQIESLQVQLDNSCLGDCPHCKQKMPEQTLIDARQRLETQIINKKQEKVSQEQEFISKLDTYQEGLNKANDALLNIPSDIDDRLNQLSHSISQEQNKLNEANTAVAVIDTQIRNAIQQLTSLKAKKESAEKLVGWEIEEKQVQDIQNELVEFNESLSVMQVKMKGHEINSVMLKDDGVKAQMVDQYLPYLNEKINERLQKMNQFIHIELDNEFEIDMVAPDRKGQGISSLSSGQKCRIDLAIMRGWQSLAKAAASCDTNLLILDEVLESLSEQGMADFMELWNSEDNGDIGLYVITQRTKEFREYFDNEIMYKLEDGSTVLINEKE